MSSQSISSGERPNLWLHIFRTFVVWQHIHADEDGYSTITKPDNCTRFKSYLMTWFTDDMKARGLENVRLTSVTTYCPGGTELKFENGVDIELGVLIDTYVAHFR